MSEPVTFLSASFVIGAISVPLAMGFVPPNRLYGVRTARTLADSALWYRVNRFAGCSFLVAAAASICVFAITPALASGRSFLGLLVFLVPLFGALAAVAVYLRKSTSGGSA